MPRLRLLCLVLTFLVVAPAPAHAHQRADLSVVSPAEGAVLSGESIEVVVAAAGTDLTQADFSLRLDGRLVDTSGAVGAGSLFTTFSLRAGEQRRLRVAAPKPGEHELRLVYAPDPDDPKPDVVRLFRTAAGSRTSVVPALLAAGAASAVLGAAVVVRRRRGPLGR